MSSDHTMQDFTVVLSTMDGGTVRDELTGKMCELVEQLAGRAKATQRKAAGSLTLKLELTVEPNGLVSIENDVTVKPPKAIRRADHFYADKGGGLSRKDPRQRELEFRDVSTTPAEIREVGDALHAQQGKKSKKGA